MKSRIFLLLFSFLFIMNHVFTKQIETDSFRAENGSTITVNFIHHASFFFIFDGITIYVDPVYYEGVEYRMLPKADVILITHDHYDHFSKEEVYNISKPSTVIYCPKPVSEFLETKIVLRNGEHASSIIDVEAVPAYNTTPGREIYHPEGRDNGYVITLGGTRIYIPGDCEDMPEMKNLENIHVAFLPINQPYTMTVDQAINAAKIIKPKILYPIHYGDTNLEKLQELKNEGIDVRIFSM